MKNNTKIDSFSLLTDLENVKIKDSKYLQKYIRVYESGEHEGSFEDFGDSEEFYNNLAYREIEGVKYKLAKVKRLWNGTNQDFIQIVVTAKMLNSKYFNGINKSNIATIVNHINQLEIIEIDTQTALSSYVTDVDLCRDYKLNSKQSKSFIEHIKASIEPSKVKYLRPFNNGNLQFNERTKATPSNPFVKIYNKALELYAKGRSEFAEIHLKGVDFNDVLRVETTIKAYKHKKRLNVQYRTLNDLLSIEQTELTELHSKMLLEYIEKGKRKMKNVELTPTDLLTLNQIERFINLKQTKEEILFFSLNGLKGMAKTRQKQRLIELFKYIENADQLEINQNENKEVIEVMKSLGIYD